MPILVHGRALLTGLLDEPVIAGGGAVIDSASIVAVGAADRLRTEHRIDSEVGGSDRIVMPGLVSAHQHGGGISSLLLGCEDASFEHWLIAMYGIVPLDPYLDTLYHALRFIENGITSTVHSHYTRDPSRYRDEIDDVIRGYRVAGMRVMFAPCFMDRGRFVYGDDNSFIERLPASIVEYAMVMGGAGVTLAEYLAVVSALRAEVDTEWTRITYGPVAPQWCTRDALEAMAGADASQVGVHTHLLESRAQRDHLDRALRGSVVSWLDDLGLVSDRSCFAHGVWLREDEIELLAARGARVIHNPSCNLRLGNGIAPLGDMLSRGISVAIGTDDMTLDDDEDLFREARLAGSLARIGNHWLSAETLVNMLTYQGAAVAGFADVTGTIEPGKRADLVLLDARALDGATESPLVDACALVIGRASASTVSSVMIGGRMVLDDGRHVGIDMHDVAGALHEVWRSQSSSSAAESLRLRARAIAAVHDSYAAGGVV